MLYIRTFELIIQEKQRAQTLEKLATAASAKPSSQSPQLSSSSSSSSSSTASLSPTLDQRPANLVRKYGGLYSQTRLETLDNLDKLPQLVSAEELKNKLLFSVMVVSCHIQRNVGASVSGLWNILCRVSSDAGAWSAVFQCC